MGRGVVRPQRKRVPIMSDGAGRIALAQIGVAELDEQVWFFAAWILAVAQLQRAREMGDGVVNPALVEKGLSQVALDPRVLWRQGQGPLIFRNGGVRLS